MSAEPLMSPQSIAQLTGLSYDTVRRAILRGELRGFKLGGKLRVRESEYVRWAYAQPVSPIPRIERPARRTPVRSLPSVRGSVARLEEIERRMTGAG
jgi:excisionase family DNA binding protein